MTGSARMGWSKRCPNSNVLFIEMFRRLAKEPAESS
jgi:hypothetical protein